VGGTPGAAVNGSGGPCVLAVWLYTYPFQAGELATIGFLNARALK